jgi:hypothetical protein
MRPPRVVVCSISNVLDMPLRLVRGSLEPRIFITHRSWTFRRFCRYPLIHFYLVPVLFNGKKNGGYHQNLQKVSRGIRVECVFHCRSPTTTDFGLDQPAVFN